jgi:hypothetical protein
MQRIKRDFIRQNFSKSAAAQASKSTVNSNNGAQSKPLLIGISVGVIVLFILLSTQDSSTEETIVDPIQQLCSEYYGINYGVSCNKAVSLALANSPGVVEEVTVGTLQVPGVSELIDKTLWMVDIRLEEPLFDEVLGREITFLRVGVDDKGIHRRALG